MGGACLQVRAGLTVGQHLGAQDHDRLGWLSLIHPPLAVNVETQFQEKGDGNKVDEPHRSYSVTKQTHLASLLRACLKEKWRGRPLLVPLECHCEMS